VFVGIFIPARIKIRYDVVNGVFCFVNQVFNDWRIALAFLADLFEIALLCNGGLDSIGFKS
jgi:hypothetical protein